MALAYTAPTWTDGSGTGISASQLQALCDCIEGLVQGNDKAVHSVDLNGSTITLTYADGTQESFSSEGLKGIVSITKTSTVGLVDTYTITYTDGTTSTFTVTNAEGPRTKKETLAANATTVTFTDLPTTGDNIIRFYIEGAANYTGIDLSTPGQVTLTYAAVNTARTVFCAIEEV